MFLCEAEGLNELRTVDGPRFPRPLLIGPQFLLMEDLKPAPRTKDYWTLLGRQLATLHAQTKPEFGFFRDNYIGSSLQPNLFSNDGYIFFANYRLNYQAELASRKGLLTKKDYKRVVDISARLDDLIPEQPASPLHGDLWSGNMISDEKGYPALIDPAVYFGWAEADLAMTSLFGRPPEIFFDAYQEVFPLQSGWEDRFPIYNLYQLLNHLNLFGSSYYDQVLEIIKYYGF
jgi:fructosamine-3-kinase